MTSSGRWPSFPDRPRSGSTVQVSDAPAAPASICRTGLDPASAGHRLTGVSSARSHPHGSHAAARDHCLSPADLLALNRHPPRPSRYGRHFPDAGHPYAAER